MYLAVNKALSMRQIYKRFFEYSPELAHCLELIWVTPTCPTAAMPLGTGWLDENDYGDSGD